jgi:spermidine synthase
MALWALSGFCILTLETVWMREIALRAGNTAVAATLVIAVFFAAAALGNLAGGRLVAGRPSALLFYGRFEVASALAAAAMFTFNRWLWTQESVLPEAWVGQLAAALLLVGPPSFFSGASFPGLAETVVEDARHRTSTGGRFYGINLLGAALGVAAGSVWLPYKLGVAGAFAVAAALQLAGGLLAWRIATSAKPNSRKPVPLPFMVPTSAGNAAPVFPNALGWSLLAASGALSLAVQTLLIVWARQALEGSVYAVSGVLTAFLSGLGAGGLSVAALRRRGRTATALLSLFAGASGLLLFALPSLGVWLCGRETALTADTPAGLLAQALLGCGLVVLPLAFCLGGVFPVAWELVSARAASEGRTLGAALAVNKLGAAAGSALGLFAVLPLCGLAHGTAALGWGYVLIASSPLLLTRRVAWSRAAAFLAAVAAVGLFQSLRSEAVLGLKTDERVLATYSGAYGPVSVIENRESGSRQILLNGRQRLSGTCRALASQRHQSWVPLLFCRSPERVATIGMAAGLSAAAALDFPLKELHSIELVPDVVAAARGHFGDWNARLFSDPRSQVHVADGRVKLARLPGTFDAIICDLFFPGEDGTASLYSRDFFASCRARLNPGGVFCLWLPCYQLTPQTAGIVIRTFTDAFPCAIAVRANLDPLQPVIGLLGANEPLPMSDEFLAARLKTTRASSPFFRSTETSRLLFVADLHRAEPGFDAFPATTDDRPLFAFLGPRLPRDKERLYGFPFLEWIGKRALRPSYPSCDLGATPSAQVLAALRAGNYLYAAAAARESLPTDPRPPALREQQVRDYLRQAVELWPAAAGLAEIETTPIPLPSPRPAVCR